MLFYVHLPFYTYDLSWHYSTDAGTWYFSAGIFTFVCTVIVNSNKFINFIIYCDTVN